MTNDCVWGYFAFFFLPVNFLAENRDFLILFS